MSLPGGIVQRIPFAKLLRHFLREHNSCFSYTAAKEKAVYEGSWTYLANDVAKELHFLRAKCTLIRVSMFVVSGVSDKSRSCDVYETYGNWIWFILLLVVDRQWTCWTHDPMVVLVLAYWDRVSCCSRIQNGVQVIIRVDVTNSYRDMSKWTMFEIL